jgi:hypothetical protein
MKDGKRSPDYGTAYCLALTDTPKWEHIPGSDNHKSYDPYENMVSGGGAHTENREPYNPYKDI